VTARIISLYEPIIASWTEASTSLAMALTLPTNTGGTVVFPTSKNLFRP
jgi:hypothetical protein